MLLLLLLLLPVSAACLCCLPLLPVSADQMLLGKSTEDSAAVA